jgi:general secretion pathway protein B
MSTILAALQKQKSSQEGHFAQQPAAEKGLLKWRVALLTSLLVIIALLCVLLYGQLLAGVKSANMPASVAPDKEPAAIAVVSQAVPVAVPELTKAKINITEELPKTVKKMTFATQPLPEYTRQEPPIKLVSNELTASPANLKKELDYEDVSDDIQQRFELALIDEPEPDKLPSAVVNNDGRDLHEMTSEFQKKVPSIRYDTHIYSSIAQDRWIKMNGKKLREGQFDAQGKIQLLEIQPNRSIFRVGRQSFSLESLTDWQGY